MSLFLRKIIFCLTIFSAVFYFRFWSQAQFNDLPHVIVPSTAIASDAPSPQKEQGRELIDINTATLEELTSLPGIGPKIAASIIKDREARGPFQTLNDLTRVKGIGDKKLKTLSPFLSLGSVVR